MRHRILALCFVMALLLTSTVAVSAEELDTGRTGTISVTLTEQYEKTPIIGAELSLYYIATVSQNAEGKLTYTYTETFAGMGIPLDDRDLAKKLDAILSAGDLPATKVSTDGEGTILCRDLPLGLYLIRQTGEVEGYAPCTPFLVTLPGENEEGYVYEVNASPKTEVAKLTSITVRKVWNIDDTTEKTQRVTVRLMQGEQIVNTAILSDENHWQVTYANMPERDDYSIVEVDVPQGFTATYEQRDYVFTVINSSSLIQTGQPVAPILVLTASGMVLIWIGLEILRKSRKANG